MKPRPSTLNLSRKLEPRSAPELLELPKLLEPPPVVQRPDGWYWLADEGHREVGPFANADDALADSRAGVPSDIEPGETLQEAEAELGIADWIDPDTGEPAEDRAPRTEEH